MKRIKKGDKVVRISHGEDIIFEVIKIIKNGRKRIAILKGITERIEVDSDVEDLVLADKEQIINSLKAIDNRFEKDINKHKNTNENRKIEQYITGKILHLDGDRRYSEKSFRYYQKMGLKAIVKNIPEYRQPSMVYNLLLYYNPDILVVTGHDGMIKKERAYDDIYNYRNSKYFIETVKEARRYEREQGKEIVIFAGACQSYFEALIMAGANFASSPARILIDFLDPLVIARKVATTDSLKYITIGDIEHELRDGKRGVGGIGANGKRIVTFM
ncbi:MAG: sporulation peptidase YabG [Clostridia bacterium]|nr:sporulation peptidase YabG [Clostridia bacterium]